MKLFLSHETSNSSIGASGEYNGPTFWVKALSKVISRGCFSNKSSVVCVASAGSKLVILLKRNFNNFSTEVVFCDRSLNGFLSVFSWCSFFWPMILELILYSFSDSWFQCLIGSFFKPFDNHYQLRRQLTIISRPIVLATGQRNFLCCCWSTTTVLQG